MFDPLSISRMRDAIRESERRRSEPIEYGKSLSYQSWNRLVHTVPIVTVKITSAIDPVTGLYDAIVTMSPDNSTWEESTSQIKVKPANIGDVFHIGKRYPARPSHPDDYDGTGTGSAKDYSKRTEVFIAYPTGQGATFSFGVGTSAGTGTWYEFEHSIITLNNSEVFVTNTTQLFVNVTNTYNNVTNTYNNSTITYGPNTQITYNTTVQQIVQQDLQFQLQNNVNFIINPAPGANNVFFVLNVPIQINKGLFLNQVAVPAIVANQNPLNLNVIVPNADAGIFRLKINVPNIKMFGIAPGAGDVPEKMLGIINAGPNVMQWIHRSSNDPQYNVRTPNAQTYYQSVHELCWFFADGSAEEWVMAAHADYGVEGTGTGTGTSGGGIADPPPCSSSNTYTAIMSGSTAADDTYNLVFVSGQTWFDSSGGTNCSLDLSVYPSPVTLTFTIPFTASATYECSSFSCSTGGLFNLVSNTGGHTWPSQLNVTNP